MKEIKAYIQRDHVNRAVGELQKAGAPGSRSGTRLRKGRFYAARNFAQGSRTCH